MNNIIKDLFSKNKTALIFLIIAFVGALLLFFGSFETVPEKIADSNTYAKEAEEDIKKIAEKICGGKAYVVLTLESGKTDNYAVNASGDYAQINSSAVYLGSNEPRVRGVAVVCHNGNSPSVQSAIISAVCCAYGVGESHVYVCGGK